MAYPDRSIAFLEAARPLVGAMKLQVVAYFSRLMPLLVEWLQAPVLELHTKVLLPPPLLQTALLLHLSLLSPISACFRIRAKSNRDAKSVTDNVLQCDGYH